jgi:hypothetical protein
VFHPFLNGVSDNLGGTNIRHSTIKMTGPNEPSYNPIFKACRTWVRSRVQLDAVWVSGIMKTNRFSSAVDVTSILPPCAWAICEAITLRSDAAGREAREIIQQSFKNGRQAAVQNWRPLANGNIKFAVRYFTCQCIDLTTEKYHLKFRRRRHGFARHRLVEDFNGTRRIVSVQELQRFARFYEVRRYA